MLIIRFSKSWSEKGLDILKVLYNSDKALIQHVLKPDLSAISIDLIKVTDENEKKQYDYERSHKELNSAYHRLRMKFPFRIQDRSYISVFKT